MIRLLKLPSQNLFDDSNTSSLEAWSTILCDEILEKCELHHIGCSRGTGVGKDYGREELEREETGLRIRGES